MAGRLAAGRLAGPLCWRAALPGGFPCWGPGSGLQPWAQLPLRRNGWPVRWHLGRCEAGDATPASGPVSSGRSRAALSCLRPAGPGHSASRLGPPYSAASGVRSTCHFLPLRSDTSRSTRPEAWAGHGLWRPRLASHWALGGGRPEEAGALGPGPVLALLGSTVGVSGHSSTSAPARASTWASVLSHVARQWEAGCLSSTEDLRAARPQAHPNSLAGFGAKRSLFPCSAKSLVRPRGWGTADGSQKVAMWAAKAAVRPRCPSPCVPALYRLPEPPPTRRCPRRPFASDGARTQSGVNACDTFACPTPSAHGRCRCALGSWPLS